MAKNHAERAHSKFSASGSERWFNCPGSVELSEGRPDKSSKWALEGTQAHEVLETLMGDALEHDLRKVSPGLSAVLMISNPKEMIKLGALAANFILSLHKQTPDSDAIVETRVYLDFIHPEMFGTFDGAVIDYFGTLHVFDYKYGSGMAVSPKENLQMIFYGIGLAHKYNWNFKRVRLWIIQPRIKGYDGPLFWDISTKELRAYVGKFERAVERVETRPDELREGSWCHWCKAKSICPLKTQKRMNEAVQIFKDLRGGKNAKSKNESQAEDEGDYEVEVFTSEADWRKESRRKKGSKKRVAKASVAYKEESFDDEEQDEDDPY